MVTYLASVTRKLNRIKKTKKNKQWTEAVADMTLLRAELGERDTED